MTVLHTSTTKLMKLRGTDIKARLNIENFYQLISAGFKPGATFSVVVDQFSVILKIDSTGTNTVSPKQFKRRSGDVTGSRIDLRRKDLSHLGECDSLFVIYRAGVLVITLVPTELNNILRREQLVTAIKSGRLSATSIFSGIGTLDCALQDGFAQHGLELNTLVANDCWDKATTGYLSNLQNMHSGASVVSHTVGIEQLIAGQAVDLSNTDLLVAGLVCKGASKLNVATRDLPESHREAGHQFINVLMLLAQSGFSVPMLLVENVVPYTSTIGYMLLCRVLEEQGYQCVLVGDHSEAAYDGINGHDYGDFERRKRMCLLALPSGVEFEQSGLEKYKSINQRTIAQIREPECMIDQKDYTKGQNLFSEKKRSKGWRTKIVQDTETSTHVLSAQCYKQRSEDPRFAHPEGEGSRIPTVIEHARLKGHPESMIDALPLQTHAHEALGNGVMRKAFVAVGAVIAQNMKRWASID